MMMLRVGALACLFFLNSTIFAQQPVFDVASIKPASPDETGSQTAWYSNRLVGRNVTLKQLIAWGYQITATQINGGPSWLGSKQFDMEAKAEGSHTKDELLQMLQPLLADRFKLALSRDKKEMAVYALIAGKNGLRLEEAKVHRPKNISIRPVPTTEKGALVVEIIGQSVTTEYLASYMSGYLDRVVVDHTDLKKNYDFKVEVMLTEHLSDNQTIVADALWDVVGQLGLSLRSQKEPVEIFVIDHAEEPSAN